MQSYKGNQLEKEVKIGDDSLAPYIPAADLVRAVNHAIILRRPLLLKGEPGCGKTLLAKAVAHELGVYPNRYFEWRVKSTTKAQDGLYSFDYLQRLHEVQIQAKPNAPEQEKQDISLIKYLSKGPVYQAFEAAIKNPEKPVVLLIDEIDKADIDFPNDLLHELEQKSFIINELNQKTYKEEREIKVPKENNLIVFITSNNEKELPDAFLRRCLFHYISFPSRTQLEKIVNMHYPKLGREITTHIVSEFENIRMEYEQEIPNDKSPSTSELLDWGRLLSFFIEQEDEPAFEKAKADFSILLKSENAIKTIRQEVNKS